MTFSNILYYVSGNLSELLDCYFCESCNAVITQNDVKIEVDSYFCPGCLENIPSSEAYLNNFSCTRCYDCSRCMSTVALKSDNTDEYSDYEEENKTSFSNNSISCNYCKLTFVTGNPLFDKDTLEFKSYSSNLSLQILNNFEKKDSIHLQIFKYLIELMNSFFFNSESKSNFTKENSISINADNKSSDEIKNTTMQNLENKIINLENRLKEKNLWIQKENIKELCIINSTLSDEFQNKNNLTFKQYLYNPEIINSFYISSRFKLSKKLNLFPFLKKKLCVQFSKRCGACQRLVIKPQLNPLAQPPFRVNLTANLFMPNFKLEAIKENVLYKDEIFSKSIRIKIENFMDKPVRVDFLPEKQQIELSNFNNSEETCSISLIEPKRVDVDPKWDPTLEQTQIQHPAMERRNRNKKFIDIYISQLPVKKELKLKLFGMASFQSPTGVDSIIQFEIHCKSI